MVASCGLSPEIRAHCKYGWEDLAGISNSALDALAQITCSLHFPPRAFVLREGEPSSGVFLLRKGRAKLWTHTSGGRLLILGIASAPADGALRSEPFRYLGLEAALTGTPCDYTVETMQYCDFDFLRRKDFLRFLREHPDVCQQIAHEVSCDYLAAFDLLRNLALSHSVPKRLARLLLDSTTGDTGNSFVRMRLPLTHEEISQLIGASRESVTRSLLQFKRRGIVEIDGSTLTIHSRAALVALAESAPVSPEVEVAHDAPQGRRQVEMLRQQLRTARTELHRTGAIFLKLHVDTALTCVGLARQARDLRGELLGWQGARRTLRYRFEAH